jgi:hypothetical protein
MNIREWLGQVTTGHGIMILAPTILAVMFHQMTWQQAVPLLVAGVIGILWPENPQLKTTGQAATSDIIQVVQAFFAGKAQAGVPAGTVAVTVPGSEISTGA